MMDLLKRTVDQFLGRGEAAITVPPMDGPFKPNQHLEHAETVASFEAPVDMAWDGQSLWVADGANLLRQKMDGQWVREHTFDRPVTAVTYLKSAGIVAAVGGDELHAPTNRDWRSGKRSVAHAPLQCITSLGVASDGSLLVTQGSASHETEQWSHDLMSLGHTGRVCKITASGDADQELASGLRYAFGAIEMQDGIWVSESWAHRLVCAGASGRGARTVLDRLPAYPSRMSAAPDGGAWLTLFAARTRLVEFVLREPEYRQRMMREVPPAYWVTPALSSGNSFLEPLQGGSVKQLGIMKPWAPPRSYGLVVRLGADGLPLFSLHSRADGRHHGIVSICEVGEFVYVLSRGSRQLLRVRLNAVKAKEAV